MRVGWKALRWRPQAARPVPRAHGRGLGCSITRRGGVSAGAFRSPCAELHPSRQGSRSLRQRNGLLVDDVLEQRASLEGLELHRGLVRLDFRQDVAAGDIVADLLEPLEQRASVMSAPIWGMVTSMAMGLSSGTTSSRGRLR